jgi:hypothetical protein
VAIALIVGVSVFAIFYYGVFSGGVTQGSLTPVPSTTGNGTPPPSGPCTFKSPYGFTTINADEQLVGYYKQLNVCWVRYQFHWDKIEKSPGVYDWSAVDTAVQTMNAAGIHVDFAIQSAPSFNQTLTCYGTPYLPGPNQMAQFASTIATRYDGKHGHGEIDVFEIGNEEYDNHFVQNPTLSEACRSAKNYGPVLEAGYKAIKAANPNALVGMFGQWLRDINHINTFFNDLFAGGYGPYMDYMNFHFYNGGRDPSQSYGNVPSFNLWWQTLHNIATKYGYANKPIWVTETGWPTHPTLHPEQPVSPDVQAQYLQYVMTQSAQSGVVQRVFWFTINYGNQGDNIYPPSGPLPAFFTFKEIVLQKPYWS